MFDPRLDPQQEKSGTGTKGHKSRVTRPILRGKLTKGLEINTFSALTHFLSSSFKSSNVNIEYPPYKASLDASAEQIQNHKPMVRVVDHRFVICLPPTANAVVCSLRAVPYLTKRIVEQWECGEFISVEPFVKFSNPTVLSGYRSLLLCLYSTKQGATRQAHL